jgi:Virulence factor BrkB
LAYYTVFSLAPMVLVLLAVFGLIYGNSEVARREILHQLYSFLDRSSAKAVEDITASAGKPTASVVATVVGIAVALFGASGVFGQLQDALNTIWGVKPEPGRSLVSFVRNDAIAGRSPKVIFGPRGKSMETPRGTRDDRLRQPVFLGIREDKNANKVVREKAS